MVVPLHILFLTDNYPPEVNAPASRTYEHIREWVGAGNVHVTVITCAPNFPSGRVFEGFENSWRSTTKEPGVTVIRVWTYISANEGFLKRTLDYVSFGVMSFFHGLAVQEPDVVIATSPQIFTACSGALLSLAKRKPFIFELRDLWPESIRAVGAVRNESVLRALERLEYALYARADHIISVTHAFKRVLASNGVAPDKISVVTNGVDASRFSPRSRHSELNERLGLGDKLIFGYVGTHGMAHALETLVEAAAALEHEGLTDKFAVLFVGDGARKIPVMKHAKVLGTSSVQFIPSVSKDDVVNYWSLLDVSIIHLKKTSLFETVIPSKIFECMGMGIPMLMGVQGEAGELVQKEGAGLAFEPENATALASEMRKLILDPDLRRELGHNAMAAAPKYDRATLARNMLQHIQSVTDATASGKR